MPVHTIALNGRPTKRYFEHSSQGLPGSESSTGASRPADAGPPAKHPKFTQEEAEALRLKGFRFSIYRPEEDEFRLSLPLQTIEDRGNGTLTIEQG